MIDLLIIGAGPGGYELALEARKHGLSVVLIEKHKLGGVCLQCGCIPTKTWVRSAEVLHELPRYQGLGFNFRDFDFDFTKVQERKNTIIQTLEEGIDFSLKKAGVEVIYGAAKFTSPHHVQVGESMFEAQTIVIATGSRPMMIPGFANALDSTALLNLDHLPSSLVIIGGGVIGVEMACIMQAMGSKVTIVEFMDRIVPLADKEVSKRLQAYMKSQGISFYLSSKAISSSGQEVTIESKQQLLTIPTEQVLVSVGRRPNVEDLGLEQAGVAFTSKGIVVNDYFQTNVEHIYAIGDVVNKGMLAHIATYQGYHALHHMLKQDSFIRFDLVPNCVFSFPEVAWVGLTEEELESQSYISYKSLYRANGKAYAMDQTDGFIKILVKDEAIVGVHIIGAQAATLIQEMSSLMVLGISKSQFEAIIHAHPTLNELFHTCFNN